PLNVHHAFTGCDYKGPLSAKARNNTTELTLLKISISRPITRDMKSSILALFAVIGQILASHRERIARQALGAPVFVHSFLLPGSARGTRPILPSARPHEGERALRGRTPRPTLTFLPHAPVGRTAHPTRNSALFHHSWRAGRVRGRTPACMFRC